MEGGQRDRGTRERGRHKVSRIFRVKKSRSFHSIPGEQHTCLNMMELGAFFVFVLAPLPIQLFNNVGLVNVKESAGRPVPCLTGLTLLSTCKQRFITC